MSFARTQADEETGASRRLIILGGAGGLLLLAAVVYLLVPGHRSDSPTPESDPDRFQIEQTVGRFEDAAATPTAAKNAFAAQSLPKPAALKAYQKYGYRVAARPEIGGTTATVRVALTDSKTGADVGEQTWEFVKESDKWKVKSAPLP